jgi:hypothetical protein
MKDNWIVYKVLILKECQSEKAHPLPPITQGKKKDKNL